MTVTMVTAAPLVELKILLHPALLDSAVGCRAIEIDRFVDRFTGRLPARRSAEQAIENQQALYEHAWATRFVIAYETLGDGDRGSLASTLEHARTVIEDPNKLAAAGRAAADGLWLSSAAMSPVVAKPQYDDPSLLTPIRECTAAAGGEISKLDSCLKGRFEAESARYSWGSARWFVPPPETIDWSGVREQNYSLDPELRFLSQSTSSSFSPLDFMLQVSFTSAPGFLPDGQDADSYDDSGTLGVPPVEGGNPAGSSGRGGPDTGGPGDPSHHARVHAPAAPLSGRARGTARPALSHRAPARTGQGHSNRVVALPHNALEPSPRSYRGDSHRTSRGG